MTQAVLENWHTAPINEKLRAMLGYLEKLTLYPDTLTAADVESLHTVEISEAAMIDAIYVCVLFNIVDRLADALGFAIPLSFTSDAKLMLWHGYRF